MYAVLYSYHETEFAICSVRILAIILVVTVVSYLANNRGMFIAGTLGSLVGFVIPQSHRHSSYASGADAFMGSIHRTADHLMFCGMVGAIVGCFVVFMCSNGDGERQNKYSLRTLFLLTTAAAIVFAVFRLL